MLPFHAAHVAPGSEYRLPRVEYNLNEVTQLPTSNLLGCLHHAAHVPLGQGYRLPGLDYQLESIHTAAYLDVGICVGLRCVADEHGITL